MSSTTDDRPDAPLEPNWDHSVLQIAPAGGPGASPTQVELWTVDLRTVGDSFDRLHSLLSRAERERLDRFLVDRARHHFLFGAGLMRVVLSRMLGARPQALVFGVTPDGKPHLSGPHVSSDIRFNISHSGDLVVLAVSRGKEVGIDVERVERAEKVLDLEDRILSGRERVRLRNLRGQNRAIALLRTWVRKEALLKAVGCGLRVPMPSFSIGEGGRCTDLDVQPSGRTREHGELAWADVPCPSGHLGATAVFSPWTLSR